MLAANVNQHLKSLCSLVGFVSSCSQILFLLLVQQQQRQQHYSKYVVISAAIPRDFLAITARVSQHLFSSPR